MIYHISERPHVSWADQDRRNDCKRNERQTQVRERTNPSLYGLYTMNRAEFTGGSNS